MGSKNTGLENSKDRSTKNNQTAKPQREKKDRIETKRHMEHS